MGLLFPLKGQSQENEYFLMVYKIEQLISVIVLMVSKLLIGFVVMLKNYMSSRLNPGSQLKKLIFKFCIFCYFFGQ